MMITNVESGVLAGLIAGITVILIAAGRPHERSDFMKRIARESAVTARRASRGWRTRERMCRASSPMRGA
jgi:hypothetical protein